MITTLKYLLFAAFLFPFTGNAQNITNNIEDLSFMSPNRAGKDGKIKIRQPSGLIYVIEQQKKIKNETFQGWRVQIFFGSGQSAKQRAERVKERFLMRYGGKHRAYANYESPYWKVRVGDFRTKAEALYFREQLSKMFNSIWIVKDDVNYPED